MHFSEQDIKVYSGGHGYCTRLAKQDIDEQWINAFLYVHFKKGVDVPDKTKIHLKDSWLSFYQNKDKNVVLYLFVNDFDIVKE